MRIKIFVLLCLTAIMQFTGVTPLKASHYYYKQLSLKDGVTSAVRCILTDKQGFVWIGTKAGISRYDGHELKKYNGTYANTGSCVAVTNYLQHEDLERMKKGEEVQPFFNQFRDYVSAREVTFKIDNNKAKLSRTDAKFYVITVSPSEKELRCMGGTPQERAEALRRYIRQDVMRNYAEGFGKGLRSDDVEYYAKIHFNRDGDSDSDSDMHAHIIVSRKDRSNTRKLSPKTNHTGKKNCGNVKGSFDRTDFFRKCESSFDRRMGFDREPEESFDYLNAVKNGNPAEIARQVERAQRIRKEKWDNLKTELQTRQEPEMSKIRQVEKTPDIEQPTPKKQQEEDLELRQKPKKSRGFGMGSW